MGELVDGVIWHSKVNNNPLFPWQSHNSYSNCGLGSAGTDKLVQLVHNAQHTKSYNGKESLLFGAKITGGGCGGTVCILGKNSVETTEQISKVHRISKFCNPCSMWYYLACILSSFCHEKWTLHVKELACLLKEDGLIKDKLVGLRKSCAMAFQMQQEYKIATGHLPFIFEGSSPGAGKFGYLRIRRKVIHHWKCL